MWYRKNPMWYRYFRCGIGIFPLRAFPIPHRKLFLTVQSVFKEKEFLKYKANFSTYLGKLNFEKVKEKTSN
jgi:hypothetical protein